MTWGASRHFDLRVGIADRMRHRRPSFGSICRMLFGVTGEGVSLAVGSDYQEGAEGGLRQSVTFSAQAGPWSPTSCGLHP